MYLNSFRMFMYMDFHALVCSLQLSGSSLYFINVTAKSCTNENIAVMPEVKFVVFIAYLLRKEFFRVTLSLRLLGSM